MRPFLVTLTVILLALTIGAIVFGSIVLADADTILQQQAGIRLLGFALDALIGVVMSVGALAISGQLEKRNDLIEHTMAPSHR